VHIAVNNGINLIDTAPYYGLTAAETVLGKALHEIGRDRYYLGTKVGRYGKTQEDFDFSAERVTRSVRRNFLPDDLEEEISAAGIDGVVSVQAPDT
jgi:L-galactose dehydrogenase